MVETTAQLTDDELAALYFLYKCEEVAYRRDLRRKRVAQRETEAARAQLLVAQVALRKLNREADYSFTVT